MKIIAVVAAALTSSAALAQVTYATTGSNVAKVVATVAEATGEKLTVDKDLAKEIIVVSVKDVPLDEFKQRLADCLSGKWVEKEGGVIELRIDAAISADRRKAAQEAYAKGIPEQIKSSLEAYSQEGVGAIRQDTPSTNELALQIGKRIAETHYRNVTPNTRIVFSSHPNRMQLQLPDVSDLISKYVDSEPAAFIKEIVFAIERPDFDEFTRFALYGLDGSGVPNRQVTFTYLSLGGISKSAPPPSATGVPITWSQVSLELSKLYRTWGYRAIHGLLLMPQSVREALSKPSQIDPMSFGFGEGILACAAEKDENVMACIPDDNVGGVFSMAVPGTTTGEFWRLVSSRKTLVAGREDGWITVRPADPVAAREFRGDRTALAKVIQKAEESVWPSLTDISEFAASNTRHPRLPMAFLLPYQTLVNNYGRADRGYEFSFRPLQLFACLSGSEKQKLKNGERLSFSSLSPKAKEVLEEIVFGPSGVVFGYNVSGESTELFPNGLGADFFLSATVKSTFVLAPLLDAGESNMAPAPMSARDIAIGRWNKAHDDNPYAQEVPEMNRVLLGSRQVWDISLLRGSTQIGKVSVADDNIPKGAKPTTMEALPQEVKDVLQKAYQDYIKEMGGG